MLKRLIIELEDDDFRAIFGAILKTNANFTVESIGELDTAPKTKKFRTESGETPKDIILKKLSADRKIHNSNLPVLSRDYGFSKTTFSAAAKKMVEDGILKRDGDYFLATGIC